MSEMLDNKKVRTRNYEILFLRNDAADDVEVHEVKCVDFVTVKERLERGESVFITSKNAQKLVNFKRDKPKSLKTKLVTAFHIEPVQ